MQTGGDGWGSGGDWVAEVFVRGLPWSTTEPELHEWLVAGGCLSVVHVKIPVRRDGKSSGTAFVKFADEQGAANACALNGQELGGRWLSIAPAQARGGGGGGGGGYGAIGGGAVGGGGGNAPAAGEVFEVQVRGLPWATTEPELQAWLEAGGCSSVTNVKIPLHNDGSSSGKAFVKLGDEASAVAATALSGNELGGRSLVISATRQSRPFGGRGSGKPQGCTTIYIGNLSWDINEEIVREFFSGCGTVTRVNFATYRDSGRLRGFGHVEFAETEAVDPAVALAGTMLLGRELRVDYAERRR